MLFVAVLHRFIYFERREERTREELSRVALKTAAYLLQVRVCNTTFQYFSNLFDYRNEFLHGVQRATGERQPGQGQIPRSLHPRRKHCIIFFLFSLLNSTSNGSQFRPNFSTCRSRRAKWTTWAASTTAWAAKWCTSRVTGDAKTRLREESEYFIQAIQTMFDDTAKLNGIQSGSTSEWTTNVLTR